MTSRQETAQLLRQGFSLTEIAKLRNRTMSTIVQHLRLQLGEGKLRPAEIILAFKPEHREHLDQLLTKHENHTYATFERHAVRQGFSPEDARLYYELRDSAALRGDIYVLISDIEIGLHNLIQQSLVLRFGAQEQEWWRLGVPTRVRKDCVEAREDDPEPVSDAYRYTTFIHLSDIIDANWSVFQEVFSSIKDKKALLTRLREVNHLRNSVMHPVKRKPW